MPRGGRREGAGRPGGVPNKASIARQEEVAATGQTPLDYMLAVMRDATQPDDRRDEMAKASAPYVHPKLAATQVTGEGGGPLQVEIVRFSDVEQDTPTE